MDSTVKFSRASAYLLVKSENLNSGILVILSIVFSSMKNIISDKAIPCNCLSDLV